MKALVLKEYNLLQYEDVPDPEAGPGDVLVAVKACGICGSDVHGMDGSTGRRRPPIIMGHEAAGVIAEVGRDVSGWKPGERVTFDSTVYCGRCEYCRRGQINLCDQRRVLGVSCQEYRQNGAFAEYVTVPARILYRLPEDLPFEHAALVEPFSIALHAMLRVAPDRTDTAVIIGAGMIGLALVQVLRELEGIRLIVVDLADDRLALASQCGATEVINPSTADPLQTIQRLTDGRGADVAFEAVGISATVNLALNCLCKGGGAVLVGNLAPKVEFPLQTVVTRELLVRGSCASRVEFEMCLDRLARGQLHPSQLISAIAPLAEGAKWFERLHSKQRGLLKVILKP